jgi:uncharacterized membrane protein
MISPARASALIQPILAMMAGLFVIVFIYGVMTNSDYEDDDEFTVTITYDCARVLTERNYPGEVLQECLELRDEIKRRNH